jgi:hypothetical protein
MVNKLQNPKDGRLMPHPIQTIADNSEEEFQSMIDEYFEGLWDERKFYGRDGQSWTEPFMRPPTMAGIALHIGTTRRTLIRYMKDPENPCHATLSRALERIADYAEQALYDKNSTSGAQFTLRVNHKYGEEEEERGEGFSQVVTTPAPADSARAIPKWDD